MEFLNIGAGEIILIILLALMLFGPKEIAAIMRTIGKYTRAASKAWAQAKAALEGELLPEEVQEVVDETKNILDEVKHPLNEVDESVKEVNQTIKEEITGIDAPLNTAVRDVRAATTKAAAEVNADIAANKAKLRMHKADGQPALESADVDKIIEDEAETDAPPLSPTTPETVAEEVETTAVMETPIEIEKPVPDTIESNDSDNNASSQSAADATDSDTKSDTREGTPNLTEIMAFVRTMEIEDDEEPTPAVPEADEEIPEDPGVSEILALIGKSPAQSNTEEAPL